MLAKNPMVGIIKKSCNIKKLACFDKGHKPPKAEGQFLKFEKVMVVRVLMLNF